MHSKANIKQKTFYIQGLRSFRDTLPKNIKRIINKKGFAYTEILNRWSYLVGSKISQVSFPKAIRTPGKNAPGILIINVQRGNEIDLEFSKNIIIEKINSHFGYKVLNNIRLKAFGNFEKKIIEKIINKKKIGKKKILYSLNFDNKLRDSIKSINNEKIKKSLAKLINSIQK